MSHSYRSALALDDLRIEFGKGVTALLGPNGAGKSTLLEIGAGILPPKCGTVTATRGDTSYRSRDREYRRIVGWLPQHFSVPLNFSALDFLRYAAWLRGLPSNRVDAAAEAALASVDLLDHGTSKLGVFSGGMIRRVGIAQAIVHDPAVVLLDEPTVGLDPEQRSEFRRIVVDLGNAATVVLSTHLTEDVAVACDAVAVLAAGRIEFLGTIEEFRRHGTSVARGETEFDCAYREILHVGDV